LQRGKHHNFIVVATWTGHAQSHKSRLLVWLAYTKPQGETIKKTQNKIRAHILEEFKKRKSPQRQMQRAKIHHFSVMRIVTGRP